MRRWAAAERRAAVPPPVRGPLRLADRMAWPLAALLRTRVFAVRLGLSGAARRRLFLDCLLSGGDPMDVHVWRSAFGGRHPLPPRSAGFLLKRLGDPATHALLADKLAAAEHLTPAGAVFPALRGVVRKGEPAGPAVAAIPEGDLFVKPRLGHGGRAAFSLTWADGVGRIDGRAVDGPALRERLERLARADDLLLQDRQMASPEMADLATDGRAPVLRLTTARRPGGSPFLHSALLTVAVPERDPRNFLFGAVHVSVRVSADRAEARLGEGIVLGAPTERLRRLEWNGAPLSGRPLPDFAAAAAMALGAMTALPPLPLVHWDMILTADGPVVLEGNTAGNWIIASLPSLDGAAACPLHPLLALWLPAHAQPSGR